MGRKGLILAIPVAVLLAGAVWYNTMLSKLHHVEVAPIQYTEEVTAEPETTETIRIVEATEVATVPHIPSSDDYVNFLIVGQAAREGETERFADSMVLCTVNTYEKTLTMTSLLRDSFVQMPTYRGHTGGRIKLTTIYHLGSLFGDGVAGSMELMNLTLYENFGIEVDHNFEIDFECFARIVDLLGGIDLEITEAEADYLNADDFWVEHSFEPGTVHLNGREALCFARMRKAHGDGGSDITRTGRQRKVIEVILSQLRTRSVPELQKMADQVLPLISTSMDHFEITKVLLTLLPILPELQIREGGTCPVHYRGDMVEIYGDGVQHSVLRFDEAATKKEMRRITKGEE